MDGKNDEWREKGSVLNRKNMELKKHLDCKSLNLKSWLTLKNLCFGWKVKLIHSYDLRESLMRSSLRIDVHSDEPIKSF